MTTTSATNVEPFAARTGRRAELGAFGALLLRDVRVLRRNLGQFLIRTIMQPLLFVFVFAYVFPKIGQGFGSHGAGGGGPTFSTILVPGLMAMAVIFTAIQAVALPLVQEFSYTKEIEDRVLAPLPIWGVGLGKLVAAALQAIIASLATFPIAYYIHAKGQAPDIHIESWWLFVTVLVLAACMGATVGLLIGTGFAPNQVPLLFSIIVLPMSMLGCIYYPWATLGPIPWLKVGVLFNPLVYMSEGMRAALTTGEHMPPAAFLGAMASATLVLGALALRQFHKRVVT